MGLVAVSCSWFDPRVKTKINRSAAAMPASANFGNPLRSCGSPGTVSICAGSAGAGATGKAFAGFNAGRVAVPPVPPTPQPRCIAFRDRPRQAGRTAKATSIP